MALSQRDREWVQLTARELTREVLKCMMPEHIEACPHGHTVQKLVAGGKGLLLGLLLASGSVGFALGSLIRL